MGRKNKKILPVSLEEEVESDDDEDCFPFFELPIMSVRKTLKGVVFATPVLFCNFVT